MRAKKKSPPVNTENIHLGGSKATFRYAMHMQCIYKYVNTHVDCKMSFPLTAKIKKIGQIFCSGKKKNAHALTSTPLYCDWTYASMKTKISSAPIAQTIKMDIMLRKPK